MEIVEDKLATKEDLKELRVELEHRFSNLESNLKNSVAQIDSKFEILETRMTVKMGAMLAASIAILTAIQKLTG